MHHPLGLARLELQPPTIARVIDAERYLGRIGFDRPVLNDVATLEALQRAHMTAVPFENLHVFARIGVRTDLEWSLTKIVDQGRGGWCFENNGAFGALLAALGFDVIRLGAAVLLDGPNTVIDHHCLEVGLDTPYLVDVGFGESFIRPLDLNSRDPQDGGIGTFELIDSSEGITLTRHENGVPVPQYRFRRVAHELSDFEAASQRLAADPDLHWSAKPFATRLIDGGPERVTLLKDRLKFHRGGSTDESPVAPEDWAATLEQWFSLSMPS